MATKKTTAKTAETVIIDEAVATGKKTVEQAIDATNSWNKGVEEMGKAYFAFAQNNIETAISASKAIMAVKTVNEAVELHSYLTRNNVDQLVAESTKLSELAYKVTNDALAPIQSHMTESLAKLTKSAT